MNNTPNATQEEKQEAIQRLINKRDEINNQINQASRNNEVEQQKNDGLHVLEAIHTNSIKKDTALEELQTKFNSQNELISNNKDATTEEKAAANQKLSRVAETTHHAIEDAVETSQVNVEMNKGIDSIRDIQPLAVKKPSTKSEFEKAVQSKKAEINQIQDATQDELRYALNQLDQLHETAKNSVNQDVQVKPQALEEIHNHAESQKERINVIAEATKEEKDVALQKVDALLKQAQNIINTVSKNHQVNDAKASSIEEIHKVNPIALVKPQALTDIANQLDAQRIIIKNNQEATIEEKRLQ
ncbi:DUF1542 domain-containing protein [Staphylococcus saccharolyticus]|uniref:DUF1542 domain-containing protein n=2 Tax=Staphylococcus saccharolyticus TaxID=33028 RepID=UPI001E30D5C0|nr:DUF1542 domain-containing protein [Staphylococcus saccharolyticus]